MKYVVIDELNNDVFTKEFNDLELAITEARSQATTARGRKITVLESANPDPDAENHLDGCEVWSSAQKYEVDIIDANGTISPIDTITAPSDYTAEDYISDCESNADDDWNEMLKNNEIKLVIID